MERNETRGERKKRGNDGGDAARVTGMLPRAAALRGGAPDGVAICGAQSIQQRRCTHKEMVRTQTDETWRALLPRVAKGDAECASREVRREFCRARTSRTIALPSAHFMWRAGVRLPPLFLFPAPQGW